MKRENAKNNIDNENINIPVDKKKQGKINEGDKKKMDSSKRNIRDAPEYHERIREHLSELLKIMLHDFSCIGLLVSFFHKIYLTGNIAQAR